MSGKTSQELRHAIELFKSGKSISEAARMAGVARTTMYRSSLYKSLIASKSAAAEALPPLFL